MKLTEAQKKLVETKWDELHSTCPMCGNTQFALADRVFEFREFNEGNLVIGGGDNSVIPMIVAVCDKCGDMRFLNALVLGVLDNGEKKVKIDGKAK